MKNNDYFHGDRCVAIVPSDTSDNVVGPYQAWLVGTAYTTGIQVYSGGKGWTAVAGSTGVTPVEGVNWHEIPNVTPVPSIIYADTAGAGGTVKGITYGGDTATLTIAAGAGLLAGGQIRFRRILATGTTATVLYAIAGD